MLLIWRPFPVAIDFGNHPSLFPHGYPANPFYNRAQIARPNYGISFIRRSRWGVDLRHRHRESSERYLAGSRREGECARAAYRVESHTSGHCHRGCFHCEAGRSSESRGYRASKATRSTLSVGGTGCHRANASATCAQTGSDVTSLAAGPRRKDTCAGSSAARSAEDHHCTRSDGVRERPSTGSGCAFCASGSSGRAAQASRAEKEIL